MAFVKDTPSQGIGVVQPDQNLTHRIAPRQRVKPLTTTLRLW